MKKLIKLSALVVAMGMAGSALSATAPADIGDVTLKGAISDIQTNWVFTVFDYPNGEDINLVAGNADKTANAGMDTYSLSAMPWAQAAGGYLALARAPGTNAFAAYRPISVELLSNGQVLTATQGTTDGVPSVQLAAMVDGSEKGTLELKLANTRLSGMPLINNNGNASGYIYGAAGGTYTNYAPGTSCFSGEATIFMITDPDMGNNGPRVAAALASNGGSELAALTNAMLDLAWQSPKFNPAPFDGHSFDQLQNSNCETFNAVDATSSANQSYQEAYQFGVIALAVKPSTLVVNEGTVGAWNAALTVSIAQL
ncbi:hypothetical protein [Providencia sp. PROV111]|uniref:hypothetical protein n=1 Tax=Providencia sp. PROV111 TaxID=2949822 RepID=UPI00234ACB1D|nr:hypothetical protein [Providencia sp. PROV111]